MGKSLPNQREEIILMILIAGERYGRDIRNEFEQRIKQVMPLGSLYTTLDRMEEKGFVRSRMGDSEHERGGNRRKYYVITAKGIDSLNLLRTAMGTLPKVGVVYGT
jgi:PadR family transcriptional regulator, regulatory protein PadR